MNEANIPITEEDVLAAFSSLKKRAKCERDTGQSRNESFRRSRLMFDDTDDLAVL